MATREAIMGALFAKLEDAYPWKVTSRRLRLWTEVPPADRPALFLVEHAEIYSRQSETFGKRSMEASIFVYIDAKDPSAVGASAINDIMDAIDTALAPAGADIPLQRQTLGRAVSHCYIDGNVLKDPGDIDGDGIILAPVKILLP